MNSAYGLLNNLNKFDHSGYLSGQFSSESGTSLKTENADITIVTDDGDRVTISSDMSTSESYYSYSGLLRSGDSMIRADEYGYQREMQSDFSLSIVGDLDDEEYADIMSALETIDSVMENALTLNMEDLQTVADKLGGLDSLSSLNASIEVTESVSYERTQSAFTAENTAAGEDTKDKRNAGKLDHALDKILDSGRNHGKEHGKVKHLMNDYLAGLLDTMSEESEEKEQIHETGELIKDMIMDRLAEKTQTEAVPDSVVSV